LRLLSPELRQKIQDNAGRVAAILLDYVETTLSKTVAPKGTPMSKLHTTEVQRSHYGAAKALQPVFSKVDPMRILLRTASVMLYYAERPEAFLHSDAVYKAQLFHVVRRLHRLAERFYWDERRARTKHGGIRSLYSLPTMRARELGEAWLLEALVPSAMILLRTVRAAENAHRVEVKLARDLGAQSEAEIADSSVRQAPPYECRLSETLSRS
jgi:hypothetical protein